MEPDGREIVSALRWPTWFQKDLEGTVLRVFNQENEFFDEFVQEYIV